MNMDVCQNVSVSGECKQEKVLTPSCSKLSTFSSSLDDLFSAQNTEVDVGLEWLSVFVEDCFSSPPSCVLVPNGVKTTSTSTSSKPSGTLQRTRKNESPLQNFAVPGKARSKRKRLSAPRTKDPLSIWSRHLNPQNEALSSDPPLLKQAYWLADSELIVTKQKEESEGIKEEEEVVEKGIVSKESFVDSESEVSNGQHPMPRRCTHCLAQRTPQWRAGPLGPKTLCNACGVRYKSGRLLPEYRPAKSPTFVSYLHSNSHKKVMEMRMAVPSSIPSEQ
ncbi:GATA transcription factor 9-like [Gastrolobium bilobum]|uniref:GATA transcription factor 9-like n=1 Tax=Gastrolobium bilobum TaxID=150636 RepID=UPI002AB30CAD|nr:GATA transcription factor 9-like [Gastrolobium bilobum]